ncbi:MAG: exodeoxyribonuclease V subunit alpha [Kiritimatiellae bacterium]|nr:exodeoxyribonuclease V subunit alpha [Kiritimatiellia bacterium]
MKRMRDESPLTGQVRGLVSRMAPDAPAWAWDLCALAVEAVGGGGDICIDPAEVAGLTWAQAWEALHDDGVGVAGGGSGEAFPDASVLTGALADGLWGLADADGSTGAPFVAARGALYTRRNFLYERNVARRLREMAAADAGVSAAAPGEEALTSLGLSDPLQREAVRLLLTRSPALLDGGPGTGKTYTVVRAMALALRREPSLRIALLAPTGKAAARLNESLSRALRDLKALPGWAEIAETIPTDARTIHRCIGGRPDGTVAHGPADPVAFDWVVVDEASMVDLPLFSKLLDALPAGCRLTLVGDGRQLASVERGRIFADLCTVTGAGAAGPLAGRRVTLQTSHRFKEGDAISALAAALRSGSPDALDAALARGAPAVVHHGPSGNALARDPAFVAAVREAFAPLAAARTPEDALAALSRAAVLCALRRGPAGADALNAAIGTMPFLRDAPVPWMVTRNNNEFALFNGMTGVILPDQPERVWFPAKTSGEIRSVHRALLPDLVPAWALTIHKSQGSEYDRVLLVLPDDPSSRILANELLYTGLTRAKSRIDLWAAPASLHRCASTRTFRHSRLPDALA